MRFLMLAAALFLSTSTVALSASSTREIGSFPSNIVYPLTDGATIAVDASLAFSYSVTLGGNRTIATATNGVAGAIYTFLIKQDGTGSRTLTWGSGWNFPVVTSTPTPPTLSTAANATDVLVFVSDGTYMNYIAISKQVGHSLPDAPSSMTATPGGSSGSGNCALGWTDHSGGVYAFEIWSQDEAFPGFSPLTTTAVGATTYTDSSVASGNTYDYKVRGTDGAGNYTAFSNIPSCLVP